MIFPEIKKSINSNLNKPLNELLAEGVGCIKSIQRGVASGNATISISEVDVNKSIILLNGNLSGTPPYGSQAVNGSGSGYISAFISTSFTISNAYAIGYNGNMTITNSWQVIEFY